MTASLDIHVKLIYFQKGIAAVLGRDEEVKNTGIVGQ